MATRSTIAYKTPEGKVRAIYAHWDGYPAHNGEMLRRYYTQARKIAQLVELGNLSVLAPNVFPVGTGHSFETPQDDVCIFYGRDRGETGQEPKEFETVAEWISEFGEEYNYLWDGQNWLVNDHSERDDNDFYVLDFVETKITQKDLDMIGWTAEDSNSTQH